MVQGSDGARGDSSAKTRRAGRPRRYAQLGWLGVISGSLISAGPGLIPPVSAAFPPCPPPQNNEYLLLVRGNTEAERQRVQQLLPASSTVMVCDYLNDTVVRAGGFSNLENANAWAQYMTEVEGLQAFVARPATPTPTATTVPEPTPTTPDPTAATPGSGSTPGSTSPTPAANSPTLAYAPQTLGSGYAVLVDYQYQPELAQAIQRQVGQAVGLAVYRQRAYLLIAYSPAVEGAVSTLTVLSGYGISGFIVDSQQVMMLTPAVAVK